MARGGFGMVVQKRGNPGRLVKFSQLVVHAEPQGEEEELQAEEAYKTCEVAHAGLAPELYDAWKQHDADGDHAALEMERYDLGSLDMYIRRGRTLTGLDDALLALVQQLHLARICHGDLHAGNIVLRRDATGALEARAVDWMTERLDSACPSASRYLLWNDWNRLWISLETIGEDVPKTMELLERLIQSGE
jgi:hypothetical protein